MYSREGGIWVLGYVTGIITVPVVGFAAIRAMSTLTDEGSFIGTIVFGFLASSFRWPLVSGRFLGDQHRRAISRRIGLPARGFLCVEIAPAGWADLSVDEVAGSGCVE